MKTAGFCPRCNEAELDYGGTKLVDEAIGYFYVCENCNLEGIEWYNLVFDCHTIEAE